MFVFTSMFSSEYSAFYSSRNHQKTMRLLMISGEIENRILENIEINKNMSDLPAQSSFYFQDFQDSEFLSSCLATLRVSPLRYIPKMLYFRKFKKIPKRKHMKESETRVLSFCLQYCKNDSQWIFFNFFFLQDDLALKVAQYFYF